MLTAEDVPVIIVLKDQPSFKALSKENAASSLRSNTYSSQRNLVSALMEEKGRGKADKIKQFWIVNAVAVRASPELIERLSRRDDIVSIELDSELRILEDHSIMVSGGQIANTTSEIRHVNATGVWEMGINGSGINVSVIDTGINALHPDIAGRVIKGYDFVNDDADPADDNGHGTHVAGTVGGNGSGGVTTGVAPDANLLIAKVCNSGGSCTYSDIVSGIQWSVASAADIISISLGGSRDLTLTAALNNAINAGVVVIAAAGNSGPGAGTINFPAGEKNVIAVGAVDSSDIVASFSSRGPITVDGESLTKPDISAPGVNINSLRHDSSGYRSDYSGTSMATPHVSGAAALLLHAARKQGSSLTPAQIKNVLENTSVDLGTAGKDNTYGAGRINVYAAVVSIDTVSPSVMANPTVYQAGRAARNGTAVTLNATVSDDVTGVKNATVDVSSINSSLTSVSLSYVSGFWVNSSVIVEASDGTYLLNVTAYDNASNVNSTGQLIVTVDNTPPLFINASAVSSTIEAGYESSLIMANITDAASGVEQVVMNLSDIGGSSNTSMQNSSGIWQVLINSTRVGNFTLYMNATDGAGNHNSSGISLNVTDTIPPVINSALSSPDSIRADGIDSTILIISTHDFANVSSIKNVTVDLTQLGGSANQEMQNISGTWRYSVSTAAAGLNGTLLSLPVNVTDSSNNSNISTSVLLGIKAAVNVSAGNRTLFNFTIGSSSFNASISIFEFADTSDWLLVAPVDVPAPGSLINAGVALNLSNLTLNRSFRIEVGYNASFISGNESRLRLWYYNITSSSWEITENSGVDIQNKTVSGNTTHLSIFAPLADITPPAISNVASASITTSSATVSWDTDEPAHSLVRYGTAPGAYSLSAADTSNVTSHSVLLTGLSAGTTYYYIVNSTDQSGNGADSAEKSFTTSSGISATSGGGGGGGGGGGASAEDYSNIEIKEKYDLHIFKDTVTQYKFTNISNPVLFINITGNINAGEINAAVEVLRGTSSLVRAQAPGIIYKNINIWVGTSGFAVPRNIKNAEITFRVEKEWVNTMPHGSIALYRYDSQWVKLPTRKIREDKGFEYYAASTEKFSPFAITGSEDMAVPTETVGGVAGVTVDATQGETMTVTAQKAAGFEFILAISTITAICLFRKKRN